MTDQTDPIRRSDLPSIPPPEWEFHTWFPHPDGGGDMVPGQRQRGVLVRRRVSYSDWEPVRPDRWAAEPETDARTAASPAVPAPAPDRTAVWLAQHVTRAIHAKTPQPGRSDEYRIGWEEALDAAIDAARAALAAVLPAPDQQTAEELASLAVNAGRALLDEKRHYEIACQENAQLRADLEHETERRLAWQRKYNAEHARHVEVVGALVTDRAAIRAEAFNQAAAAAEEFCHGEGYEGAADELGSLLRRLAGEAQQDEAEQPDVQVWPLTRVLTEVRCGSEDWAWEEEWADLDQRHAARLAWLETEIREHGITTPVLIGNDGRLWDGHHRLRIAVRLGIGYVPVEITPAHPPQQDPAQDGEARP